MDNVFALWRRSWDASDIAAVLGAETDHLFWLIDAQSGNFSYPTLEELGDPDELIERFWLPSPALKRYHTTALRPGAVSVLGKALGHDENFHLVGFNALPEKIEILLKKFVEHKEPWWTLFQQHGEIFIEDIDDGLACLFTKRAEWFDKLLKACPDAKSISLEKWGHISGIIR